MNGPDASKQTAFWSRRVAWIDTPVLAGLLLAVNSIVAPGDIGWVHLNPSPFLLLPMLIGGRFGFTAGVGAGLFAGLLAAAGQCYTHSLDLARVAETHAYWFASMLFTGGICGQIQRAYTSHEAQAKARLESMEDRLRRLDADLYLMREAKGELERLVATRDSDVSTLDAEIRRLFDSEGEELYTSLLLLLNRQSRVTDAAIYAWDAHGRLERKAVLGSSDHLPECISPDEIEMVSLALAKKTSVSVPEFWQRTTGAPRDHLLAAPLLDSAGEPLGVVVVTGIPFIALTRKTVHVIMLVCRWAARVMELRDRSRGAYRIVQGIENQRIFTPEVFRSNLALSYQSFLDHGLPSSVVLFTLPEQGHRNQGIFEKLVMQSVRGGDFPTMLDLPRPNLAVLLPLSGERGATIFINRILVQCRANPLCRGVVPTLFVFDPKTDAETLWKKLTHGP